MAVLVNYPRVSCSKWFVLKSQHGYVWWEEPGMLKAWEAAAWTTAGAGPGCDLQHGRITLAFGLCRTAHASSLLCGNPSFTHALLVDRRSWCWAVSTLALHCSSSPHASCSLFPTFLICCSGIIALPYCKKGCFLLFSYIRSGVAW